LQHDPLAFGEAEQMVELLAYDMHTPDRLPEHSFTQDHPQFRGIITHEDVLSLDARPLCVRIR
jgi:hypothetical protein